MSHTEEARSPVNSPFFRPHAPKGSASGEPKPQESGKDTKLKVGARVECKWEKEGWVGAEVISESDPRNLQSKRTAQYYSLKPGLL